ncbi:hypothetical protein KVH27_11060 [Streptomyces olivaceus]|uniref:hypothetical protein n=1 Tax=Streptomyces olivaceus TaxID=47716 RepID=UPI001CCC9397|nr:hypothetical protein [Streptomyces olivaceus]MBZ6132638.1 hypothetical protein [Streptomyces olivaceus]MBZ6248930.1 hypothetical protein [Streptomyces olivaceus]
MTVAVVEAQAAAAANRLLVSANEHGRTFLLAVLACTGSTACASGSPWAASASAPLVRRSALSVVTT